MKFFLPLLATLIFNANAFTHERSAECIPKNNLYIPVGFAQAGVTEEQWTAVLDNVQKVYEPIFSQQGATLKIIRSWDDGTVNAQAFRDGNTWNIEMFGGLARHKETTPDGFALVACHELGHHVGGLPKIQWAANEGQSDYYGTLKCLRKVWAKDDNVAIVSKMKVDPVAAKKCSEQFKSDAEVALCARSSMAGMSLGRLLATLGRNKLPNFDTPDKSKVKKTNNFHPIAQCRLDTYFAGSICTVEAKTDVSDNDADVGVCSRKFNQEVGARPLCWYAEQTKQDPTEEITLSHNSF